MRRFIKGAIGVVVVVALVVLFIAPVFAWGTVHYATTKSFVSSFTEYRSLSCIVFGYGTTYFAWQGSPDASGNGAPNPAVYGVHPSCQAQFPTTA
jgi:hypothetical protein